MQFQKPKQNCVQGKNLRHTHMLAHKFENKNIFTIFSGKDRVTIAQATWRIFQIFCILCARTALQIRAHRIGVALSCIFVNLGCDANSTMYENEKWIRCERANGLILKKSGQMHKPFSRWLSKSFVKLMALFYSHELKDMNCHWIY
jgi:hypothetical protein